MFVLKSLISDENRSIWLTLAAAEAVKNQAEGNTLLSGDLRNRLTSLGTQFEQARQGQVALIAQRKQAVATRNLAMDRLKLYTRQAWRNLRDMIKREELPAGVLATYAYPGVGSSPSRIRTWINATAGLVAGNTAGVEAGYSPFSSPSPDMVIAVLDEVTLAESVVRDAKLAVKNGSVVINQLRSEVDDLHRQIAAWVRYKLRQASRVTKRETLRRYGFDFETVGQGTGSGTTQDNEGSGGNTGSDSTAGDAGVLADGNTSSSGGSDGAETTGTTSGEDTGDLDTTGTNTETDPSGTQEQNPVTT